MGTLFDLTPSGPRPTSEDDELNAQQRAAVAHGEGPLVVVAGAGTGKTRVITQRVVSLLETQPELTGEQILALTYTDKAAGEMRSRILKAAGERAKGLTVSTFHSFCLGLLQEVNPALQALDTVDHWILLRRNLGKLQLERYRRLAEPGQFLSDFLNFFSRCQDELVTPDDYQRYADGLSAAAEQAAPPATEEEAEARALQREEAAQQQEIAQAYRASDQLLRERNLLTFGAQMLETVHRLHGDAALLERLRARFRFILVDEFQDTNFAQIVLLELLAGPGRNLFVVGDDDQAIYRFRGASFANFHLFRDRFVLAGNAGVDARRAEVVLNENYRSSKRILRVAEASIRQNGAQNRYRPDKNLVTANPEGEKIVLAEFGHAQQEAHWVAQQIEELHRRGHAWSEFAVLYRAHTHREHLLQALRHRQIPFVIRRLSILTDPLIRDLLAYLRLVDSPHDNVACARVLAMPAWGFSAEDLMRLAERAHRGKGMSLWDALTAPADERGTLEGAGGKTTGDAAARQELVALIAGLREKARRASALELFDALVAKIGLLPFPSAGDGAHLQQFARFLREWEPKSETRSLREFCEYFRYFEEAGGQINKDEEAGRDAVELMTVHAAKGLEFNHTFVIRLSRNAFPTYARKPVLEFPLELMKEERPSGDFHVQEERRLFYVALTRARKRLTLTTVINKRSKHSVFLDDLLDERGAHTADLVQLTPTVEIPPAVEAEAGETAAQLFPGAGEARRAGSRIARWATAYRPPVFEPLELSASAVDSYAICPQKFLFESRWHLRGRPHAAVTFGNVMHLTIREFVKGLKVKPHFPFGEVETIYRREWRSAGFEDDYQESSYKQEGLEQLRAFHAAMLEAPPDVLHQEKAFALPMSGNIVITGRLDQVNHLAGGDAEIVDYKTGRPRNAEHARKSLQLSLYAIAAREALDVEPARLVFYNLETNEAVATARTERQLDAARERVAEAAADIRAGNFPTTPGFPCRTCDFRLICPASVHEELAPVPAGVAPEPAKNS